MLFFISLISLAIFPSQGTSQIKKIEGVFLGRVENGYSFCCKTVSGFDEILVFNEVLSVILEKYPLHTDKHIGENFIISFTKDIIIEKKKSREVLTILRLQKLVPGQHLRE
ncbi:hypothetical protein GCM10022258_24500 [Aquimarina gracilis]